MNAAIEPRLVNGPFGDPGLYVHLRWEGRALLFDLGQNDALPPGDLLRVSDVFVSHCHMDHFIGFDRLLRVFLGSGRLLRIYGPPGILDCVEGKLRGYTWNLVDGYAFALDVAEVSPESIRLATFRATTGFARESRDPQPFAGVVLDAADFCVRATHLDHRIFSMAYALEQKPRLNVDPAHLAALDAPPGPWLSELKEALRRTEPGSTVVTARWRREGKEYTRNFRVGEVRDTLIRQTPGRKVAYVVDTLYSPHNVERITALARGADVFFCESPFLDEDEYQATKRYHLTARQAGLLGRAAAARELQVFHFSPRYAGRAGDVYREAEAAFRGGDVRSARPDSTEAVGK